MVPKAGLEPARISTVDFESTASTDFATPALKRYAENLGNYTRRTSPCKCQHTRASLSVEKNSVNHSSLWYPYFLQFPFYHPAPSADAPPYLMLYTS